jgi:hypothetical protein
MIGSIWSGCSRETSKETAVLVYAIDGIVLRRRLAREERAASLAAQDAAYDDEPDQDDEYDRYDQDNRNDRDDRGDDHVVQRLHG